jgi:hypothetical protein
MHFVRLTRIHHDAPYASTWINVASILQMTRYPTSVSAPEHTELRFVGRGTPLLVTETPEHILDRIVGEEGQS